MILHFYRYNSIIRHVQCQNYTFKIVKKPPIYKVIRPSDPIWLRYASSLYWCVSSCEFSGPLHDTISAGNPQRKIHTNKKGGQALVRSPNLPPYILMKF